jgi:adenylate cyclase
MAQQEKPILLQRRRFEQAGYTEADRIEDLGREDHSYLCRFIFRVENVPSFGAVGSWSFLVIEHRRLTLYVKIEDEAYEGFEYIDLSARGIQTMPIFLYRQAHSIVSLNLSKNPRLDLPADFVQLCTSLRELRLSDMSIKRIPHSVRQCPGLTRLDISMNRVVDLEHSALSGAHDLLSFKAHNNRLSQLPAYFGQFRSLKYLNLSNNKFEVFPEVICDIESLVDLDISFNLLTSVPPSIGRLKMLERFVLLSNAVTSLPPTFTQLQSLRELDCRANAIVDFTVLSKLPALEVLRCNTNAATEFDASFGRVRAIDVSYNPLVRFSLQNTARTLTSLVVSHAKLSSVAPEIYDELISLETLVLDNNQIRSVHQSIGQLQRLVRLSVKNNSLDSLPDSLGSLPLLQSLDVSDNNLAAIPASIWDCPELVFLNASSNLIPEFPDPPIVSNEALPSPPIAEPNRKFSTASKATSVSSSKLAPPLASSLRRLSLADNRLTDETFHPISLITNLNVLNLSFNEIYEIPSRTLSRLPALEELYLSGNKLTTLPEEDFEKLVNLRVIYLNGNKLQTLPAELGQLKKLQVLDVGSNMLKYNISNWKYDWNWFVFTLIIVLNTMLISYDNRNWNLELRYLNLSGNKRLEIKPHVSQSVNSFEVSPTTALGKRRNLSDFSALHRMRVLGLMDVTLVNSSVPDDTENCRVRTSLSEINDMAYGIADSLGTRSNHLNVVDLVLPRFRSRDDEALLGLFDAPLRTTTQSNGSRIAKYLQDCFAASLSIELGRLREGERIEDALRRTFLNTNRDYGNILLPSFDARRKDSDFFGDRFQPANSTANDVKAGASAVIAYIVKKTMYVANVGNALAVVAGRGGYARLCSVKHDPLAPQAVARLRASEGWVSPKGLVNDEVEVSRAFGFFHIFPVVNASPEVQAYDLSESDEFVILANRGLWDYMSYQAAVDVARSERGDPMVAAQRLRDLAISYGSDSHIMVMILSLADLFKAKRAPFQRSGNASIESFTDAAVYGAQKALASRRAALFADAPGERYLTLLDHEVTPPMGMLALVFTDIRNSTLLWESNPGMHLAMRMHNQLLRRQLRAIGGYEVKTEGDAFMVSFPSITSALLWCFTVQAELLHEDWPQAILDCEDGRPIYSASGELIYRGLSVRMGIHWGEPVCERDPITRRMDYFGPMVNRAARLCAVADGGQIIASADAVDLIKTLVDDASGDGEVLAVDGQVLDEATRREVSAIRKLGFGITELGERRLKGLETPEVVSLLYPAALTDRLRHPERGMGDGDDPASKPAEMYEPIPQLLDSSQVRRLGTLCLRLESVSAANSHPLFNYGRGNDQLGASSSSPPQPPPKILHPHLSLEHYPVSLSATDEELLAMVQGMVIRIENVVSTLVLHQLGPHVEVLSALAHAIRVDSRYLEHALSIFGALNSNSSIDVVDDDHHSS